MLSLDISQLHPFLPNGTLEAYESQLEQAAEWINTHTGPGGDYTGWIHYPREYDKVEFARIQAAAKKIQQQSQVLVVVGIGGSYLGARAVIELIQSPNYNLKQWKRP